MNRLLSVCWALMLAMHTGFAVAAPASFDLDVASGETLTIDEYVADSKTLLVWLPSERGFGGNLEPVFSGLAQSAVNVWAVLLHDSYVIPTGRNSLDEIALDDLLAVLNAAQQRGFDDVFILGAYRSAALALKLAYRWQQLHAGSRLLGGLVFFSPHLTQPVTQSGEDAAFMEIATYSNLPLYILQAEYSTRFARIGALAKQLTRGGSPVFLHNLRGVINGYYMRPDEELGEQDLAMRRQLPTLLSQSLRLLKTYPGATFNDSMPVTGKPASSEQTSTASVPGLRPYHGVQTEIPLVLSDFDGNPFDLSEHKGTVVLVNFWATWCAPCVEEMPSLSRLNDKMKGKPFKIVATNIGEKADRIRQFLQRVPVNFDILLDPDSQAVRDWKVYAYPTNYLLDQQGKIRFVYRGALEWDSEDIIQTIETLF